LRYETFAESLYDERYKAYEDDDVNRLHSMLIKSVEMIIFAL